VPSDVYSREQPTAAHPDPQRTKAIHVRHLLQIICAARTCENSPANTHGRKTFHLWYLQQRFVQSS